MLVRAGPVRRDPFSGVSYPPGVAVGMDRAGRGWAVWTRMSPPRVEAARFEDGRWLPPIVLHDATLPSDGHPGRDANGAALAMNGAGQAVAGWTEDHGDWITMASRWDGSGWETAQRVQNVPTGIYAARRGLGIPGAPAISLDEIGYTWMIWYRAPRESYPRLRPAMLMGSWRPPGGVWSPEEFVADEHIYTNGHFGIAPLPRGDALVAWAHDRVLRTARVSPSRRWQWGIVTEARDASDRISGPLVAPLPEVQGALVAWSVRPLAGAVDRDLSVGAVDSGLGIEAPIAVAAEGRGPPRVAVSPTGRILTVWTTATAQWARWAESAAAPLGPAVAIAEGLIDPSGPELAVDAGGNALALWIDGTNGLRLVVSRYSVGGGWTEASAVHQGSRSDNLTLPQLAMDGSGNAIAAFSVTARVESGPPREFEVRAAHFPAPR